MAESVLDYGHTSHVERKRPMKNAMNTAAAAQYTARRSDIARLLDILAGEIESKDAEVKAGGATWGKVGDLDKVRSELIGLVAFMSNIDSENVVNALADAE
jgi:hypothetical protein